MMRKPTPLGQYIETNPGERRLVIADIHGCARTFATLLQKIGLTRNDRLFLLGDYIDRGPDSGGVLTIIINLIADGYQVYPLRGNHEQYLLEAAQYYRPLELKRYVQEVSECVGVVDEEGAILPAFRHFLEALPFFYELADCYLVHAGFNFRSRFPFQNPREMLEMRDFQASAAQTGDKRIVHGHQVTNLNDIVTNIEQRNKVLPLDNGCCFSRMSSIYYSLNQTVIGNLCCLDLDTFSLTLQENVDYSH